MYLCFCLAELIFVVFSMNRLPEAHILPGSMKDNFWEMGKPGLAARVLKSILIG